MILTKKNDKYYLLINAHFPQWQTINLPKDYYEPNGFFTNEGNDMKSHFNEEGPGYVFGALGPARQHNQKYTDKWDENNYPNTFSPRDTKSPYWPFKQTDVPSHSELIDIEHLNLEPAHNSDEAKEGIKKNNELIKEYLVKNETLI